MRLSVGPRPHGMFLVPRTDRLAQLGSSLTSRQVRAADAIVPFIIFPFLSFCCILIAMTDDTQKKKTATACHPMQLRNARSRQLEAESKRLWSRYGDAQENVPNYAHPTIQTVETEQWPATQHEPLRPRSEEVCMLHASIGMLPWVYARNRLRTTRAFTHARIHSCQSRMGLDAHRCQLHQHSPKAVSL